MHPTLAFLPPLLCALSWAMSSTPCAITPHTSDMSRRNDGSFNPPPSTYTWPPPPWLMTGTLPPGQEAPYGGHQPLLEANACYMSAPFTSHPPLPPPHLRPATMADMPAPPSDPQPKPRPIFGRVHTRDNENSLPDVNLASVLVHVKPKAMAVSKVVSGKQAGHGVKAKVKRGNAKKKVRVDSELEDGMVRGKGGRTRGAVNWLDEEFMALLDAIEDLLPAGRKAWGLVYSCFEAWAKAQGCPLC